MPLEQPPPFPMEPDGTQDAPPLAAPATGPRVYSNASRRWRLAVRRIISTRMAASACCVGRGVQLSAASIVGALEAQLAEDEEFEALMSRRKKATASAPTASRLEAP